MSTVILYNTSKTMYAYTVNEALCPLLPLDDYRSLQ